MSRRVVVVGHGMVGARFVEEVRRRDPNGSRLRLTALGAEPRAAYNRVLLSTVLAGGLSADAVALHPPGWALRSRVDLRVGVTVTAVDRERRLVHTGPDDPALSYDELVLATGSRAWLPPLPGLDAGMVDGTAVAFRDLDDCDRIITLARPGTRFAVLGGGLLGCEAARGLAGRGVRATLLHPKPHLMERQLDAEGGAVLAAALTRLGVEVRLGVRATGWRPGGGLVLAGGETVPADALVVAAGVRPETGLAAAAGIAVDRGIVVDDRLTSSDARVHAIGDCAQHAGAPAGQVQPGWEQAAVLADLLTGSDMTGAYTGTRAVTRLKARGVDLATVGEPAALQYTPAGDTEVLRFSDPVGGRYAALALRSDRVVGGTMIGLPEAAASMIQFYDSGTPAPADRLGLLFGRALPGAATATTDPGHLPAAAVVCRCNTVSKGALVAAWRDGARDVAALRRRTRAGTGCGGCGDTVAGICGWLAEVDPPTPTAVGHATQEGAA